MKVMMIRRVVNYRFQNPETHTASGTVTSRADRIPAALKLARMRLMTVAATDTGVVHFALQKRAVNENLVQDLTIGEV